MAAAANGLGESRAEGTDSNSSNSSSSGGEDGDSSTTSSSSGGQSLSANAVVSEGKGKEEEDEMKVDTVVGDKVDTAPVAVSDSEKVAVVSDGVAATGSEAEEKSSEDGASKKVRNLCFDV